MKVKLIAGEYMITINGWLHIHFFFCFLTKYAFNFTNISSKKYVVDNHNSNKCPIFQYAVTKTALQILMQLFTQFVKKYSVQSALQIETFLNPDVNVSNNISFVYFQLGIYKHSQQDAFFLRWEAFPHNLGGKGCTRKERS